VCDCRSKRGKRLRGRLYVLPELRFPISKHAAERYVERVRPEWAELERGAMFAQARKEMRVKMATAPEIRKEDFPDWFLSDDHAHGGHLLIDEDTMFLLRVPRSASPFDRYVATVVTRESSRVHYEAA
jgi:hypothetical protein